MRTEIRDRQTDILTLNTDLQGHAAPGDELRSQKAGRLYAKSGPRHTDGKSRSRLTYQTAGAAYLGESVRMALRARRVQHVDCLCKSVMAAARPEHERRQDEPNRYQVRHARAMAQIIQMAECEAARPLGFEAALGLATAHWTHLSGLEAAGASKWWADQVSEELATARQDPNKRSDPQAQSLADPSPCGAPDEASFERKHNRAQPQLTPPPPPGASTQSAAAALREGPVVWHDRSPADSHGAAEHKYGPKPSAVVPPIGSRTGLWVNTGAGQPEARPISTSAVSSSASMFATTLPGPGRASTDPVVLHPTPAKNAERAAERAAQRARGYLDDLLSGVYSADYLVESIRREDLPHLMPLMRQRADTLMAASATRRDAKAQVQDWQDWHSLARFCGEACADDGMGAHAFTRAQVLQFPLKQRLNMLATLDGPQPARREAGQGMTVLQARDLMANLQQQQGLMSAFTDAELLPPSDEVRAKALKARLQAIQQRSPGAALTADGVREVVQAHREVYALTGKPLNVVASPSLKAPFAFSEDRRTLQVSCAPRPAHERPDTVMRQLLTELARDYQHQLLQQMNDETLKEEDDRFMLAVILMACQPRLVDVELLSSGVDRPLPDSALTRHAALHAAQALRD